MENQNDNKYLGEGKISKLLLKFSIPCILSLLISSLYNIVDQIFIGNSEIGYLGNAATGIVFPITIISVAFAWCFGDGSAAYLSLCQGRGDTKSAHKAIGNSLVVTFIISIIFVVLGFIFMDNLLYLFGASASSIGLARAYFTIILTFIPVYMLANAMNAVIRADGSPAFSMASTLVGAILNIILDPIFIFVFKWGIEGAAWATIIGQCASLILSIIYYTRTKTFKLSLESFKMDFGVFSNVIKLGVSTFITQMSIVIISLVCNITLAKYGAMSEYGADIPIAVIGIAMKVFTIVINIVVGVILGAQPILGYNYGAKKLDRVKETFRIVLISTIIVGLISTVIFELCPSFVISLFGAQDELYMEFAVLTFRIFLMFVTLTCTIKMCSIFFQAVGKPINAAIVSLARDIVFFVPLVIILPNFMGVKGALWAAPVADIIGIIVTCLLYTSTSP
ncbi:MAG: MATE family efflux transporter, partial [Bacilli bacterium]|nr:MATE family efflux transporter [Bacilli bacterium]